MLGTLLRSAHGAHRTGWPSRCLVCHAWPAQTLCGQCVDRFAAPLARCTRCALPLQGGATVCGACLREPPPMDASLTALPYAWPWTHCIARFKFANDPGLARPLADLLLAAPGVADALHHAQVVVPLPLSAERLAERGYNPAQLLAARMAPASLRTDLLLRTRHTKPQHELPRAKRLTNVRGAFAVDPLRAADLRGRRVLVVDDVMTTGATLGEAARVLRAAGATHITALALARTPVGDH